ncbi:DKNYY domain-containing protein [Candidatus Parcubacteria bacterium]|nr:DKNYY domain-containing protein [Candidatus Parcubacteria bacterium]
MNIQIATVIAITIFISIIVGLISFSHKLWQKLHTNGKIIFVAIIILIIGLIWCYSSFTTTAVIIIIISIIFGLISFFRMLWKKLHTKRKKTAFVAIIILIIGLLWYSLLSWRNLGGSYYKHNFSIYALRGRCYYEDFTFTPCIKGRHPSIVKDADYSTFVALRGGWAKDKNFAYYGGKSIKKSDPNSFEIIPNNEFYAKDKNRLYLSNPSTYNNYYILSECDSSTFEVLSSGYKVFSKDKNFVYYHYKKIDGADPKTFDISTSPPRDKKYIYHITDEYGEVKIKTTKR